jgi:sulfur carrier protein ThiS
MQIEIRLHGILRDRLPREAKGQTTLLLADGTTVADLLAALGLHGYLYVAVNDRMIEEHMQRLSDSDRVEIFVPSAGG